MLDPRIGEYAGEEPEVCAVCGLPVRGWHSTQYPLDKQHYYRVRATRQNAAGEAPNRAELEAELKATIAAQVTAESAPKSYPELEPPASRRAKPVTEDSHVRSE